MAIPAQDHDPVAFVNVPAAYLRLAGFQVSTTGRFWVSPEAQKIGRVRTCKLGARRLDEETAWLERYRLVFGHGDSESMAFYSRYLDVTPYSRLVWTNEEGDDGGANGVTMATITRRCSCPDRRHYRST